MAPLAVAASGDALTPLRMTEANAGIKVDGVLNEPVWQQLASLGDMRVLRPDTLAKASHTTDIKLFYTEKGLYVGFYNEQEEDTIVERLSPRDQYISRDGNYVTLDPGGAGLYGYWFGVNLGAPWRTASFCPNVNTAVNGMAPGTAPRRESQVVGALNFLSPGP